MERLPGGAAGGGRGDGEGDDGGDGAVGEGRRRLGLRRGVCQHRRDDARRLSSARWAVCEQLRSSQASEVLVLFFRKRNEFDAGTETATIPEPKQSQSGWQRRACVAATRIETWRDMWLRHE
eukprot:1425417-Rhodomonas_salina.3